MESRSAPCWSELLPDDDRATAIAERDLAALDLPSEKKLVLLLPSPRPDPRAWPLSHWTALARELSAQREVLPIVVIGPAEQELGEQMMREFRSERSADSGVRFFLSRSGPRATVASFRKLAPMVRVAVASDGGALHLAVASGLRTVVLAGPQDPQRTGPYGADHLLLQAKIELACRPCLARRCRLVAGPRCLDEITVADVLHAIDHSAQQVAASRA